ncbi:YcaO-like family protein [Roseibium litorale]|uniref:YcaO-like family protein n=1 Tax=Roseibium litorale TaxID=2803841 RepID=A0ABR9CGB0_9HYPH|nr:YcaO-like family protein [Roseibium litorale]MBD8889951.1 YcaO-like family protein [Roseibium litorale]
MGAYGQLVQSLRKQGSPEDGIEASAGLLRAVKQLLEWGCARQGDAGFELVPPFDLQALQLFAPLLDALRPELFDISREAGPFVLMAAFPGAGAQLTGVPDAAMRSVVSGGQGRDRAGAVLSCLGELAERATLLRRHPEDFRVMARSGRDNEPALGEVLGFSAQQEAALAAARPFFAAAGGADGRINWNGLSDDRLPGRDLATGQPVSVPACGVFVETDRSSPFAGLGLGSTVGAAVWRDLDGARQRALLELVERDAVARAWYNRLGITRLPDRIWSQVLGGEAAEFLQARARTTWVLTLDCDFDAHVVVALSHGEGGLEAAFGSAARLDYASAAEGAVREMIQAERSHEFARKAWEADSRKKPDGTSRPLPPSLAYGAKTDIRQDLRLEGTEVMQQVPEQVFRPGTLLESCLSARIRLYEIDVTEPAVGIPCVKLLSPDLASWQPRFGKYRLFSGGGSETDFAARPFPF